MTSSEQPASAIYPSPAHIHFIVQNLNGSASKGRRERRSQMTTCLRRMEVRPDFLAFQDGVRWADVGHFIEVLNQRYCGAEYNHIADRWDGSVRSTTIKPTALYSQNREALIYDSSIWNALRLTTVFSDQKILRNIKTYSRAGSARGNFNIEILDTHHSSYHITAGVEDRRLNKRS